ncbi:MAG TPA: formylglycine-generating enzyme family protein, partial [Pyrinomonadaceae bacterium]
ELAEKIRNRYFPKKEAAPQRSIRVVKKARHEGDEHGDIHVSVPPGAAGQADAKPTTAVRLVKKPLPPAAYAEPPGAAVGAQKPALADVSYPTRVVTHKIEMELVMVPPGSFMMGSENGFLNEKPIHRVTISQGFFIGKYQVTQAQWQEVMGNNPSRFKGCEDCPVEMVSWEDAQEFLHKLNEMNSEYTYRLPTEAEWEYAARAGMMGDYAGDLGAIAWYDKNSDIKTHPVGHKQPNAFGLFDMHGNVWEWVQDWYHNSYVGAPTDGTAWLSDGEQKKRVVRGGSWSNAADFLRPSYRLRYNPSLHFDHCGFRVAGVARP